jgi:hypothetical protein
MREVFALADIINMNKQDSRLLFSSIQQSFTDNKWTIYFGFDYTLQQVHDDSLYGALIKAKSLSLSLTKDL